MMRSLSPLPYTSAVSKSVTPASMRSLPRLRDRRLGEVGVVATHAPRGAFAPRPGAHTQRRGGGVAAGKGDPVLAHATVSLSADPDAAAMPVMTFAAQRSRCRRPEVLGRDEVDGDRSVSAVHAGR